MQNLIVIVACCFLTGCWNNEPTIEERFEAMLQTAIDCSWLREYENSITRNNDPRSMIMSLMEYELVRRGEAEWDGSNYYYPTSDLEVFGFSVKKLTGWSRTPYGGNDIFWRPGSGELPPTFLELHLEAGVEEVEEVLTKRRDPGEYADLFITRPIKIDSIASNLTIVRCELS